MIYRPWTRQPQYPARIARDGLGRNVQMALLPLNGRLYDVANNIFWTPSGNAVANTITGRGLAASFDGVDDFYSYTGYPQIVGNVGTFFIWMPRMGGADASGVVFWGSNTGTAVWFQLSTTSDAFVFSNTTIGTVPAYNTTERSLVFSSAGTAASKAVYSNGVGVASGGAGAPASFAAGNKAFRFGAWVGGANWDSNMDCVIAGFSSVPWSEADARAFHLNPWQIFEPEPVRIFLAEPVSGGITSGAGSSAGVGSASGVGASTAASTASSAGVGAASGVGASTAASVGTSAGVATASAVGEDATSGTTDGVGSSAGVATASAVGASTAAATASASGVGAASAVGVGVQTISGVATSAGMATVLGVGSDGLAPQVDIQPTYGNGFQSSKKKRNLGSFVTRTSSHAMHTRKKCAGRSRFRDLSSWSHPRTWTTRTLSSSTYLVC